MKFSDRSTLRFLVYRALKSFDQEFPVASALDRSDTHRDRAALRVKQPYGGHKRQDRFNDGSVSDILFIRLYDDA